MCEERRAIDDEHAEGWRAYVIGDKTEVLEDPTDGEPRVLVYRPSVRRQRVRRRET